MSSSHRSSIPPVATESTVERLLYRSWPLVDEGRESLGPLLLVAAGVAAVWLGTGDPQWTILGGAILLVACVRLWLPTQVDLGPEGIKLRSLAGRRSYGWSDIRSYEIQRRGVYLVPASGISRIANLRGVYLPLPPDPQVALELLGTHLGPPRQPTGESA